MNRRTFLGTAASGIAACLAPGSRSAADEVPKEYQAAIAKGLDWVARNQARDGHWEAIGGQYPSAMTGLGGMALLMLGVFMGGQRFDVQVHASAEPEERP